MAILVNSEYVRLPIVLQAKYFRASDDDHFCGSGSPTIKEVGGSGVYTIDRCIVHTQLE